MLTYLFNRALLCFTLAFYSWIFSCFMYVIQRFFNCRPSDWCWDRTQEFCNVGIDSQTLKSLGKISSTLFIPSLFILYNKICNNPTITIGLSFFFLYQKRSSKTSADLHGFTFKLTVDVKSKKHC